MYFFQKLVYFFFFHTLLLFKWKKSTFETNKRLLHSKSEYKNALSHLLDELLNTLFRSKITLDPLDKTNQVILDELKLNHGILLTAHIGNHEYFGQYLKSEGVDLRAFHQELNSPFWNRLMNKYRLSRGNYSPYSDKQLLKAIKDFKSKRFLVGFLWDQHTKSKKYIPLALGSKTYSTNKLPTFFLKEDTPIYFGYLSKSSKKYSITLKRVSHLAAYPELLKEAIDTIPEQYYGIFHKIYKSSTHYK